MEWINSLESQYTRTKEEVQYKRSGMTISIKYNVLPFDVLEEWDRRFIPAYDLFYFREKQANAYCYPKETFTPNLDERTSFLTWNVSIECKFVSIVSNDTILSFSKEDQIGILQSQISIKRGFAFTLEQLCALPLAEESYSLLKRISFPFEILLMVASYFVTTHLFEMKK